MPGYHINSEACRRQGFHFRQVYAALRFSRDKNKAGILDVYWDCGFLGVKDGIIFYFNLSERAIKNATINLFIVWSRIILGRKMRKK